MSEYEAIALAVLVGLVLVLVHPLANRIPARIQAATALLPAGFFIGLAIAKPSILSIVSAAFMGMLPLWIMLRARRNERRPGFDEP